MTNITAMAAYGKRHFTQLGQPYGLICPNFPDNQGV